MEESDYDKIIVTLECPCCDNYLKLPVHLCINGHSICRKCYLKLEKCPLCKKRFIEARNVAFEALAKTMLYPCKKKPFGCNVKIAYDKQDEHNTVCEYSKYGYNCQWKDCTWNGPVNELKKHWLQSSHYANGPKLFAAQHGANFLSNILDYADVVLLEAYDNLFWLKCKIIDEKFFWAVQYIGEQSEANEYLYEVLIYTSRHPLGPKVSLSEYCHEIGMQNVDLFQENMSICLPLKALNERCYIQNKKFSKFFCISIMRAPKCESVSDLFKCDESESNEIINNEMVEIGQGRSDDE